MNQDSVSKLLFRRTFRPQDQLDFAALSGDRNPMHMDDIAARRLLTGRCVVHGIHTLLHALERWPCPVGEGPQRVDVDFPYPASVDQSVEYVDDGCHDGTQRVSAMVDGLPACRIALTQTSSAGPLQAVAESPVRELVIGPAPLEAPPSDWVGNRYSLPVRTTGFSQMFPHACGWLGTERVASLAALSTFVGMACPGLHSIFSSVVFEPTPNASATLRLEVVRFDPRFRVFLIRFDGPIRGELKAFLRAPAQEQPTTASLQGLVRHDEFAGTRHWVIGGSRGIGELTAKLLCVGGAQVLLTFATGSSDAEKVAADVHAAGLPRPQVRQLDMKDGDLGRWMQDAPIPTAVWYFPTPKIFRKKALLLDAECLAEFEAFYIHRFHDLCAALEARAEGHRVGVFYPSTTALSERPRGMTEYTMAKAAAEILIADMARAFRNVKARAVRLPRLATDQTAWPVLPNQVSNVSILLPLMREFLQSAGSSD